MNLKQIGWNEFFERQYKSLKLGKKNYPARVFRVEKNKYHLESEIGSKVGILTGKYLYQTESRKDFPAVGDWVVVEDITSADEVRIKFLLKRKTYFGRKEKISGGRRVMTIGNKSTTAGGATQEQIISANIDIVFIVMALDQDFNIRKMERFLIPVKKSGATPVMVLNKTDLCENVQKAKRIITESFRNMDVIEVSALKREGLEKLREYISEGITVSFLGSSGVGKSSIINVLMDNEELKTGEVNEKHHLGKHTTTWRETVILPEGGILIDNPGLRILKLFVEEEDVKNTFADIEEIISSCRYSNCSHNGEEGCAVTEAIESGKLDRERYENYIFMKAEASYMEDRKKEKESKNCRKKKQSGKSNKKNSSKKIRYVDI